MIKYLLEKFYAQEKSRKKKKKKKLVTRTNDRVFSFSFWIEGIALCTSIIMPLG